MRFFPFVSLFLLAILFPINSPIHTATGSVSGREPLITATSPVVLTLNGPPPPGTHQGGVDNLIGVTYHFLPDGTVYYTDLSGSNFTIHPLSVNLGGILHVTLPLTSLSYNSSTVEYSIINFLVLGQTVSLSMVFQKIPGSLDLNMTISGTLSISSLLLLNFTGKDTARVLPFSVYHDTEGFDWSDTKLFSPVFNSTNGILSWTVPTSFSLDPLLVDATGTTLCTNAMNTCTVTISTTHNNDLILVAAYEDSGGGIISTITDTVGNIFKPRAGGGIWVVEEWYGISPSILSSDIVTVTLTVTPSSTWGIMIIAVAGTGQNGLFDVANPATAKSSTCTGWPTINVKSNDMAVAFVGNNGVNTFTADSGYTLFVGGPANVVNGEYQIYTSTQSNIQLSFNQTPCTAGATWGMVVDIICVAGQSSCYTGGGVQIPNDFTSLNGLPPQLADQGVIGFMFFLAAGIAFFSIDLGPRKKIDQRARLG